MPTPRRPRGEAPFRLTPVPDEGFSSCESGMLARRMTEAGDAAPERRGQRALTVLSGGGAASDEALLVDFFAGSARAFGELVGRHQRLVQALVRRYVARPEDAADLSQAAFLRAFAAARRSFAKQGDLAATGTVSRLAGAHCGECRKKPRAGRQPLEI